MEHLVANYFQPYFGVHFFQPTSMNKGERPTSSYGPWLLKFAVSVSWRVLNYFLEEHELSHFPNELLLSTEKALAKWKDFMLDQSPDPGQFEQHMLPFNCLVGFDHPDMPPNINRYMLRTVDIDAVKLGEKDGFVYSKMGRIVLIGFIEISHPQRWKGTKLHVKKGVLGSKHYSLPAEFGEYFLSKARRLAEINKSMSGKQKQKIEDTYRKNINRAISSETLKAIDYDVKLFGKKAFDKNE